MATKFIGYKFTNVLAAGQMQTFMIELKGAGWFDQAFKNVDFSYKPEICLSWALSNQAALASLSVRKLSQLRDISVVWPFVPDV